MSTKSIPDIVIGRLPLYVRALQYMSKNGQIITSSQELGTLLGITAAQIRKDLSQFGEFGKQGTGYKIDYLSEQLIRILKIEKTWEVAIIGAGDVGNALARYQGFLHRGFKVTMIFDNDKKIVDTKVSEFIVKDSRDLVSTIKKAKVKIAMLAVPSAFAQEVTDQLVEAGVRAILNYAPIHLSSPPNVRIQNIDPATHLQRMTYYLDPNGE